jgi:uncharacterized protein (DUF433 family)
MTCRSKAAKTANAITQLIALEAGAWLIARQRSLWDICTQFLAGCTRLFAVPQRSKLNADLSGEQSMTVTASWISKTPDRCGGDACVRDTRITVWGLVAYRRLGMSDAEIMPAVQGLTPVDLEAAWEYAAAHPEEIDEAIRANEEGEEGLVE